MARDLDRYGGYRSRYYDRGDEGRRGQDYGGRGSDPDEGRELYSGGRYFYEGRTYASDRNRPGEYSRGYGGERTRWERGSTYEDYPERMYETDYDRDRRSRYEADYDRNRYDYGREYDRGRDWDYGRGQEYGRSSGRRHRDRWDDSWSGYGYGPEDERRMMRGEYGGRYSRGESERGSEYDRPRFGRGEYDRDRPSGSYMNRSDTWDQEYEPYRGEWQTGDRSWTRDYERHPRSRGEGYGFGYDYDRNQERNEDWERRSRRRRREMETQ